jgi:L-ascorbate metabolism protein UlaG (beta-lactamase superfamily)
MNRTLLPMILLCAACATTPAPVVSSPPADAPEIALPADGAAAPLAVIRVAHATVLVDFDGEVVLTDPWFTESAQYHQGEPLGLSLSSLPRLAAVVVSHGHYDHFDIDAFKAYPDKDVPFFVVAGLAEKVRAAGFRRVRELAPWEGKRGWGDVCRWGDRNKSGL